MSVEPRRDEPIDAARLTKLWNSGMLIVEIAAAMSIHTRTVKRQAAKLKLEPRKTVSDFWTDEKLEALKAHLKRGTSFRDIGVALGCTRNAVISKANRIDYERPDRPIRDLRAPKPRARVQRSISPSRIDFFAGKAPVSPPPPEPIPFNRPFASTAPKPWLERKPFECAYPVSGEGADTFSCCAPVWEQRPYCQPHAERVFVKPRSEAEIAADQKRAANARAGKAKRAA